MLPLNNKSIGKVRRCRWFLLIKIFVYSEKQCFRYQILVHTILLHCANRIHRNQRCYLSVSLQSYLNQHNSRKRALLTLFFFIFKEGFFFLWGAFKATVQAQHLPVCMHSALSAQGQLFTGRAWTHIGLQPYLQSQAQSLEWAKESRQHWSIVFLDCLITITVLTSLLTFPP